MNELLEARKLLTKLEGFKTPSKVKKAEQLRALIVGLENSTFSQPIKRFQPKKYEVFK